MTITVATALSAGASPVRGLTLEAALTHVARTNPSLQAARDGARSSHEGVPLALSAWLPTIQASGSHAWTDRDSRSPVEGHQETRSAELSYSHNLYRAGVDRAALRRAEAEVGERTTRELLDAERNLVSRQVNALSAERNVIEHAYALLAATGGLTVRRLMIEGVPDLDHEARETRERSALGALLLRLHRDRAEDVSELGHEARETRARMAPGALPGALLLRLHARAGTSEPASYRGRSGSSEYR